MTRGYTVGANVSGVITALGMDPSVILRRAGLPGDLFARGAFTLSAERYFDVWTAMQVEYRDDDLAVNAVQALTVETFDPPLFAGLCSANLISAAQRIAVYKRLIGPMELDVEVTRDSLRLSVRCIATPPPPAVLAEAEVLFWIAFARAGTREPIRPRTLWLPDPRTGSAALAEFVGGARLVRSSTLAIEFSAADAHRPFLTRNNEMWQLFEPGLRGSLDQLAADASWSDRVDTVLVTALAAGIDAITHVAAELALSPRSLQRHLATEGTTFAQVLARTREKLALHYLRRTSLSNTEIALLLGYDEPTSFHRAFHGWTGQTPGSARSQGTTSVTES